jgi:hypothetical protein
LSIRPILSLFQWQSKNIRLRPRRPKREFSHIGCLSVQIFIKSLFDKEGRLGTIWRKGLLIKTVLNPTMASPCKHPRVRVVSRQEDVEYVECLECGEVFDSDEFRDMEIEEKASDGSSADAEA